MSYPAFISCYSFDPFNNFSRCLSFARRNRKTARTIHFAGFLIDIFHTNEHYKVSFFTTEFRQCSLYSGEPPLLFSVANFEKNAHSLRGKQYSYFLDKPSTMHYVPRLNKLNKLSSVNIKIYVELNLINISL